MIYLQPYRHLDVSLIQELIERENIYLVSQVYNRAKSETADKQTPFLLTAYRQFEEASLHFSALEEKDDQLASIINLSIKTELFALINLCNGEGKKLPFLAQVKDTEYIDWHIKEHYDQRLRTWLNREKERWDVNEYHVPQYTLITILGEPMISINYGSRFAIVSLDELEKV